MYGYGYQYSAIANSGSGGAVNPAIALFAAYKSRVETDSGVVENNACTITFFENII